MGVAPGGRVVLSCRGRAGLFATYRLRVAEVVRDYGLHERREAPPRERA